MDTLEKTLNQQDVLLVLGGENQERTRTLQAYETFLFSENEPLIILAGNKIFKDNEEAQAKIMQQYLQKLDIPQEKLKTETTARDTIGHIYFTQPLIDDALSGKIKKRIGIITDQYHMKRSLWAANQILDNKYEIQPIPAPNNGTNIQRIKEKIILNAWKYDFKKQGIQKGDEDSINHYMHEVHPLHAKNPPLTAYKTLMMLAKSTRKL